LSNIHVLHQALLVHVLVHHAVVHPLLLVPLQAVVILLHTCLLTKYYMGSNFKIDCTYENIIDKFASFIYNSCHNLTLWSTVPEFAKSGYSKTYSLERIYPALGDSRFLNPGPNLYITV
jgi:hypothetical protein